MSEVASRNVQVDRIHLAQVIDELKTARSHNTKISRELYIFESMLELGMRYQKRDERGESEDSIYLLKQSVKEIKE